jgi:hypothetical protein
MSGRRPRRSSLCPRPLSAMRTDVRPTGRADLRCPRDRCPRDRCDPGVRTGRRPVSAAAAAALSAPRWILEGVGAAGPATFGAPGWMCRCGRWAAWCRCSNRAWRGRDGRTLAVRGWHEGRRQSRAAACMRTRLRRRARRLADQGSWSSARVLGRLAGEQGRSRCSQVPAGASWQVAGVVADHGLDREVVTTLRGRCAGGGPVSSGSGGPIRFIGEQTAAAARPR